MSKKKTFIKNIFSKENEEENEFEVEKWWKKCKKIDDYRGGGIVTIFTRGISPCSYL